MGRYEEEEEVHQQVLPLGRLLVLAPDRETKHVDSEAFIESNFLHFTWHLNERHRVSRHNLTVFHIRRYHLSLKKCHEEIILSSV